MIKINFRQFCLSAIVGLTLVSASAANTAQAQVTYIGGPQVVAPPATARFGQHATVVYVGVDTADVANQLEPIRVIAGGVELNAGAGCWLEAGPVGSGTVILYWDDTWTDATGAIQPTIPSFGPAGTNKIRGLWVGGKVVPTFTVPKAVGGGWSTSWSHHAFTDRAAANNADVKARLKALEDANAKLDAKMRPSDDKATKKTDEKKDEKKPEAEQGGPAGTAGSKGNN